MKKLLLPLLLSFAFIFTSCEALSGLFNQDNGEPSVADLAKYLVTIDENDVTQSTDSIELSNGEWECSRESFNTYPHPYAVVYVKFKIQNPNITFIDGIDVWRDVNLSQNDLVYAKMQGYDVAKKRKVYTGTKDDIADLVNFVKNHVIGSKNDWDSTKTNPEKTKFICKDARDSTREILIVRKLSDSTEPVKTYNPNDYQNPVPEDAISIFNPHDFQDYYLPSNFSSIDQGYVTQIEDDETYGKVLHFNRLGEFPYTSAQFSVGGISLKDKTLYMVMKGKSEIDNSTYTDLKVMIENGYGSSETYNFIPKDDTKYVTYSASTSQFWGTYGKTAISDWSNEGFLLQFDFQMANYDLKIAAIYCK